MIAAAALSAVRICVTSGSLFLIAHFGSGASSAEMAKTYATIVLCGLIASFGLQFDYYIAGAEARADASGIPLPRLRQIAALVVLCFCAAAALAGSIIGRANWGLAYAIVTTGALTFAVSNNIANYCLGKGHELGAGVFFVLPNLPLVCVAAAMALWPWQAYEVLLQAYVLALVGTVGYAVHRLRGHAVRQLNVLDASRPGKLLATASQSIIIWYFAIGASRTGTPNLSTYLAVQRLFDGVCSFLMTVIHARVTPEILHAYSSARVLAAVFVRMLQIALPPALALATLGYVAIFVVGLNGTPWLLYVLESALVGFKILLALCSFLLMKSVPAKSTLFEVVTVIIAITFLWIADERILVRQAFLLAAYASVVAVAFWMLYLAKRRPKELEKVQQI